MTYEEAAGILISQAIVLGRASGKSTLERIRIQAICKAVEALEKQIESPTVDAVEIVRCKYCAVPHNKYTGCPKLNGLVTPPDFYCPFGERKQVKHNDIFVQQIRYYSAYVQ